MSVAQDITRRHIFEQIRESMRIHQLVSDHFRRSHWEIYGKVSERREASYPNIDPINRLALAGRIQALSTPAGDP